MTTEELNKILNLSREGVPAREIAEILDLGLGTVGRVIAKKEIIDHYTSCPSCGSPIPYYKKGAGRKRIYCSETCRHSKKLQKVDDRICLNCGRHFITWKYKHIKYCSHSCYVEHRYGKRLQNKSS